MADNILAKDAVGTTVTLRSTSVGGVHNQHRRIDDLRVVITATPTISTSAYTIGFVVGGLLTLANAALSTDGRCRIRKIVIADAGNKQAQYDILLFNADPSSGATITNHAALVIGAAARTASEGFVTLSAWSAAGTGGAIGVVEPDIYMTLTGTSLYAVIIDRSGVTPAGASDLTIHFTISRD